MAKLTGQGQTWMQTPQFVFDQVREICDTMMLSRNTFKRLRDNQQYVVQHTANAKMLFMKELDNIYNYLSSIRRNYAHDDAQAQNKQIIDHYENKLAQLSVKIQEEIKAKEGAMTRISELSSRLLKAGNSDITELSDPNRPMKLAEEFNQIYDDDWTDAFEVITEEKKKSDEDAIGILYTMLQKCKDYCSEAAKMQYNQIEDLITSPTLWSGQQTKQPKAASAGKKEAPKMSKTMGSKPSKQADMKGSHQQEQDLGNDEFECSSKTEPHIKEFRKMVAAETLKSLTMEITSKLRQSKDFPEDILSSPDVHKYLQKCIRMAWLMEAQYPPMVIDMSVKAGDKFNQDVFREYRTRGTKVTMPVWPPIYLHHKGPLIVKGFVDGDGKK